MAKRDDWRALIGLGLVLVLVGALGFRDAVGRGALVIGLVCVVAGAAWRILRGPEESRPPR